MFRYQEATSQNIHHVSCVEPSHIYVECMADLFASDANRLGLYVFEQDQVYTRLQSGSDRVLMNHGTTTSKAVNADPNISFYKT